MIYATAARYRMLIKSDHGIYPVRHISSSSSSSYANITSRPYAQRLPLHLRFVAIIISAVRPRLLNPLLQGSPDRFCIICLHCVPVTLRDDFKISINKCVSVLNINDYHASYVVKMHIRIICHAHVTSKELV